MHRMTPNLTTKMLSWKIKIVINMYMFVLHSRFENVSTLSHLVKEQWLFYSEMRDFSTFAKSIWGGKG